jgi:hypothetical protein
MMDECSMCKGVGMIAVTDGTNTGFEACPKCSKDCNHHQSRTIYREKVTAEGTEYEQAGFWCMGCDKVFAID